MVTARAMRQERGPPQSLAGSRDRHAPLKREDLGPVGAGLRQCSTLWQRTIILKAGLSVTLRDR
jgi:hypothetical protein